MQESLNFLWVHDKIIKIGGREETPLRTLFRKDDTGP